MNPIDRTALITGGNSGLGLECARALLQQQPAWHVIIASRGRERSEVAVDDLRASGGPGTVEARALDLGSLADVRRFADGLLADLRGAALPPLRALVCNAGLQFTHRAVSADGFEATFAVNHLGHYLLTELLLGALVPPARIVFVTSGTHDPAERTGMPHPSYRGARALADPTADGGDADPGRFGRRAYSTSKLCNVLCTYELSRRLEASGLSQPDAPITVNAFDPGLMPGTGLGRDYPGWLRFVWRYVLPVMTLLPKVNSTRTSGRNLAWVVSDPGLEHTTAKYFRSRRAVPSSRDSHNEAWARELWEESAALVGLAAHETAFAAPQAADRLDPSAARG
ncbi:MAG TPA: SDR family NAD(P)-dependent oxidoreductase [Candidatus Dormibacteraeota bacterium]|nr:SDR family NAD(P)-dependent oxidoreductase [Candidatus Dormibacteraeota bacterium]